MNRIKIRTIWQISLKRNVHCPYSIKSTKINMGSKPNYIWSANDEVWVQQVHQNHKSSMCLSRIGIYCRIWWICRTFSWNLCISCQRSISKIDSHIFTKLSIGGCSQKNKKILTGFLMILRYLPMIFLLFPEQSNKQIQWILGTKLHISHIILQV